MTKHELKDLGFRAGVAYQYFDPSLYLTLGEYLRRVAKDHQLHGPAARQTLRQAATLGIWAATTKVVLPYY